MLNVKLGILGELHASTLMYIINIIWGWIIVERILLFIKCVKMKWQWKKYYKKQSQNRRH